MIIDKKQSKKIILLALLIIGGCIAALSALQKNSIMYSEQEAYKELVDHIDMVIKDNALPVAYNDIAVIKNRAKELIYKKTLYPRLQPVVFIRDVELLKQEFDRYIQEQYPDFFMNTIIATRLYQS